MRKPTATPIAPARTAIHHSRVVPLARRQSERPKGMSSPPMTKVGTPISRLFVISTSACASKRALRSVSTSGDSVSASISRSQ